MRFPYLITSKSLCIKQVVHGQDYRPYPLLGPLLELIGAALLGFQILTL
jgi:hypothetical protein